MSLVCTFLRISLRSCLLLYSMYCTYSRATVPCAQNTAGCMWVCASVEQGLPRPERRRGGLPWAAERRVRVPGNTLLRYKRCALREPD